MGIHLSWICNYHWQFLTILFFFIQNCSMMGTVGSFFYILYYIQLSQLLYFLFNFPRSCKKYWSCLWTRQCYFDGFDFSSVYNGGRHVISCMNHIITFLNFFFYFLVSEKNYPNKEIHHQLRNQIKWASYHVVYEIN